MELEIQDLTRMALSFGLRALGGLALLVVGYLLAGFASRRVRRAAQRTERIDPTLTPVIAKVTWLGIMILTLIAVLHQFGVQTTSLIALLGAIGLAIGLALQGALGNVAAGVILLALRPFEVGDTVEVGGETLVVDEISLLTTRAHTVDNVYAMLPNSSVWGSAIKNFSRNPQRRIDLVVGIGYGDPIDKALAVLRDLLAADERILEQPEPFLGVGELGESSVDLLVRPWVRTSDFLAVKTGLTRAIKERFDREGISIPFPQRDLHIVDGPPRAAA